MEFLKDLGLDKLLLVAQIVNFLILFFVLKAVFYKPLKKILEERKEKISKGIEDADAAKELRERTVKEKDEIIRTARIEVQALIEDSRKAADEIKQKIVDDAKTQSEEMVKDAQKRAEEEMKKMEKQIKVMSLDISKKIMENVIPVLMDDAQKNAVLKKAVQKLDEEKIYE